MPDQPERYTLDVTKSGDKMRREAIDKLPEEVEIVNDQGEKVTIKYREMVRQQDDDWIRVRDQAANLIGEIFK